MKHSPFNLHHSPFILLLLAACFVLASCNTENANRPRGKRIGTWMAFAKKANWVGAINPQPMALASVAAGSDSDTDSVQVEHVFLSNPNGLRLTMKLFDEVPFPMIILEDSSFVYGDRVRIRFIIEGHTLIGPVRLKGPDSNIKWIQTLLRNFDCNKSYSNAPNLQAVYISEITDDTLKITTLKTSGLYKTAKYLVGCR